MTPDTPSPIVVWSTAELVAAVSALPAPGPLPCRTMLVPHERLAHALRRDLIRTGHPQALAGTRFITPAAAAVAVLTAAGATFRPGEERLRTARLRALFQTPLTLQHFSQELLRSRPGWDEAFAHTIGDLERAGRVPEDLERVDGAPLDRARLSDVAAIWRAASTSAGESRSTATIYREAARALQAAPSLWPFPGQTLAITWGHAAPAQADFFQAIPGATLALQAARPVRRQHLDRVAAVFSRSVAETLARASAPRDSDTERNILASYLFE